jgi:major vault protein
MEERRPRERELVLAPNEYAYVLDTTKGHINCYVGPNKTSLAQTDQPVIFNALTKRFDASSEIRDAVQLFATAPANWYMVLKNPGKDGAHPKPGMASGLVDLVVGKKVIIPGPATFALWPGQMAKVVEGHRLRTNQYLLIRVYDAEEANKHPAAVLGTETTELFEVGDKRVIRGSDVSFYMPPNGVEVVPDDDGKYVRDAVTLQRLEYCVLVGEDGKKRYVRGEAVVFPEPEQRFLDEGGRRKKAIELSEITGIHVKVIAPYVDDEGVAHAEGEELFITGKNKIYFPREEHAIIKTGLSEVHHAIAIPAGEGRYVLNRLSGEITLRRGPSMFLPDPRREVITRRVLADRECGLYFPNNEEALAMNRALRRGSLPAPAKKEPPPPPIGIVKDPIEGVDSFARSYVPPRTIMLDGKYDGAVAVDVWSGFAVQVVDKKGKRRVVRGPSTILLEWDEALEALSLSTGTPKSTNKLLHTAYLQIAGNQVSDTVEIASSDLVKAAVSVKYRVSFEGNAGEEKWFDVDNYVKLLCDHASSLIKAAARQTPIRRLRAEVAEIVRDTILGKKDAGPRSGLAFGENGMRVVDVEVLELYVTDDEVSDLLDHAQLSAIRSAVSVAEKEAALLDRRRIETIEQELLQAEHTTKTLRAQLEAAREATMRTLDEERARHDEQMKLQKLALRAKETDAEIAERERRQALEIAMLREHVEAAVKQGAAFSPELIAAVTRLGDAQLLSALSANFGELAAVEGRGLLETARKFLDFVPQTSLPMLKPTKLAEREGDAE